MLFIPVQTATGTSSLASTNVAFGNNTVAGNSIVVVCGNSSTTSGDVSGVTDTQGNTYQKAFTTDNALVGDLEIWYASGIIGGANTVTVAYTTGVSCAVIAREYYGTIYQNMLDKQTSNTGNSNSLSSSNTTALTQTNELLVGAGLIPLGDSFTVGSGYSNLTTLSAPTIIVVAMEDQLVTNGGVQSATFGANTTLQWVCGIATFFLLPTGTTTSTSSTSSTSSSISSTSSSTSISSTSTSSTSASTSSTSSSTSVSSTSSSISSTSSSVSSTSMSSTSSSTSISSTSSSVSSTSTSSTSTSSTSSSMSTSSTSISFSSTSSSVSSTSTSYSSTSASTSSTSNSTSTTTLPPLYLDYSYQDISNLDHPSTRTSLLSFSGLTLDVTAAAAANVSNIASAITVSAWVKITGNIGGTHDFFAQWASPNDHFLLRRGAGGLYTFFVSTDGSGASSSGASHTSTLPNVWTHVVGTYDGATLRIYVNGLLESSSALSSSLFSSSTNVVRVGAQSNGSNTLTGSVASARIWNVALTTSQVANLYSSGIVPSSGLVLEWLIAEGSGSVLHDTSGNGYNTSIVGGTPVWVANDLAAPLTTSQYSNLSSDDGDYFIGSGSQNIVSEYKQIAATNTQNITATWKGRTTIPPTTSPVLLQIYNFNTPGWETIASQTIIAADTDFTLQATRSTNLSNYYDARNTVIIRVYQKVV